MLELVARELEADDARLEVGVRPPREQDAAIELASGFRLVAVFDHPRDDIAARRERLAALAQTFEATLDAATLGAPFPSTTALAASALDEALAALARIASATAVVVIDERSPMIWGCSLQPRGPEDADVAVWLSIAAVAASRVGIEFAALLAAPADEVAAALDRAGPATEDRNRIARAVSRIQSTGLRRTPEEAHAFVVAMRAVAAARRGTGEDRAPAGGHDGPGWLARDFGGIYRLVLAFDAPYSELHAESAAKRALPVIERLVMALPPVDPQGGGGGSKGQVVRLFGPR